MSFESYDKSLKNLDVSFEQMQEIIEKSEKESSSFSRMDQAVQILFQAEKDIEHLTDFNYHSVSDAFAWDPTERLDKLKSSPNAVGVEKMIQDHAKQKAVTDELTQQVKALENAQDRLSSLKGAFGKFGVQLQNQRDRMDQVSNRREQSLANLNNKVMPRLDTTMEQLEMTTQTFEHEVHRRQPIIEALGKELFALLAQIGGMPFIPPPPAAAAAAPADPAAGGGDPAAAAAAAAAAVAAAGGDATAQAAAAQAATATAGQQAAAAAAAAAAQATADQQVTAQAPTATAGQQAAAAASAAAAVAAAEATDSDAHDASSDDASSDDADDEDVFDPHDRGRSDEIEGIHDDLDRGRSDERFKKKKKKDE